MKDREPSSLLRDVLEQSVPLEFQARAMEKTLRAARHRKQVRQLGCGTFAVATILLLVMNFRPGSPARLHPESSSVSIVHSQKLDSKMLLTERLSAPQVTSSKLSFAMVRTQEGGFKLLSDDELLDCFAGHPAALVRRSDGQAELVFVNPADMEGFPVARQLQ